MGRQEEVTITLRLAVTSIQHDTFRCIITVQKKISGLHADRYFFIHTITVYNRADDAVKRTRFFNSLVIKYQTADAAVKVPDWQRIETIT